MFFYDIPNLLAILILIVASFRMSLIPLWLSFFLGVFALTPFFLNDVLFPATYMPDQFAYYDRVHEIRSQGLIAGLLNIDFDNNIKLLVSNWMLAIIPLPYVETIKSLGFFNRLIATTLIIWLYSSKNLRGWPLLFVLFYPSFLLYSSLALRDTLVLVFMIVPVILFLENRRLLALIVSSPLFFIKFQNFFLILIFFVVHLYFSRGSIFYRYRYMFLIIVVGGLAPFIMEIIKLLDFYRWALFYEDGGFLRDYVPIETFSEFVVVALQSAPYFLMKPFPWESSNFLQLIQSVENIFIFTVLAFMFLKASSIDKKIAIKWLAYLIAAFSIYGLVVFNFGTAVRYKFPFILIVIIGMAYELYLKHGKLILNKEDKVKN
tara:strand:+ start:73 stop:1200 length:1128 start_codon:yes stop_codon:yes gene_type:complete